MIDYYKILCGIIALGLTIYNICTHNPVITCYWFAVTLYWVFNFIGG